MNENTIREVITPVPTDAEQPRMYQHAVYLLGAVAILGVIGIVALAFAGREVSEGLIAIGAGAVAYIGGLLTPRRA